MEKRLLALSIMVVLAPTATSVAQSTQCWNIPRMQGQSLYEEKEFQPIKDGFSNKITLIFDGENSSVTGSVLVYLQWGPTSMVGLGQGPGWSTIESWIVDPVMKRAFYTKSVLGNAGATIMRGIDGVRAFVGEAEPCN